MIGLLGAAQAAFDTLGSIQPTLYVGPTPWRNVRLSNNKYADCEAMARKKPRLHLASDMRNMANWKPRCKD